KQSLHRIWERFYKTDISRGKDQTGTGLGLSIVKEIINAHGQNINVISTEGVGTEFIFTLEKAEEIFTLLFSLFPYCLTGQKASAACGLLSPDIRLSA